LALPLGLTLAVVGIWNAVRFGSPLETGYGTAVLTMPALIAARGRGVFSWRHVPANVATLIGAGFDVSNKFPWLVPPAWGHSVLLTTPALLIGVAAPWREATVRVMAAAAGLITLAILAYYGGGGYLTYGYRYFLDATPFLLVLVGLAMRRHLGRLEQALIVASVAFCTYGIVTGVLKLYSL
jgi:hypothetical protein